MESLAAYLQERTEACHWDRLTREYDKRREVRAEKVTRTLSIVNEARGSGPLGLAEGQPMTIDDDDRPTADLVMDGL